MSDILAGFIILGVVLVSIATVWKFSYSNKPKDSLERLSVLHVERVRIMQSHLDGEFFKINECEKCEDRWPCDAKIVLDWIEKECK